MMGLGMLHQKTEREEKTNSSLHNLQVAAVVVHAVPIMNSTNRSSSPIILHGVKIFSYILNWITINSNARSWFLAVFLFFEKNMGKFWKFILECKLDWFCNFWEKFTKFCISRNWKIYIPGSYYQCSFVSIFVFGFWFQFCDGSEVAINHP